MVQFANLPKPKIEELIIKAKNGRKIIMASFRGRDFTREEIQYLCQKLDNEIKKKANGDQSS